MTNFYFHSWNCTLTELQFLVRRANLTRSLIRLQQEESIASAVPLNPSVIEEKRKTWLAGRNLPDALSEKQWSEEDLDLHLHRQDALLRFSRQRFGPGLEEIFLSMLGSRDRVVYSLIRSRDMALLREIWIRLEENEVSFAEAATTFGEGPEAARKGVMGPLSIGSLQPPELQTRLRSMAVGEISEPFALGDWHVLLLLEQLTPAQYDDDMRSTLLKEQLDRFINDRIDRCLSGQPLEPILFDPET